MVLVRVVHRSRLNEAYLQPLKKMLIRSHKKALFTVIKKAYLH